MEGVIPSLFQGQYVVNCISMYRKNECEFFENMI